jgi:hypothetical protein
MPSACKRFVKFWLLATLAGLTGVAAFNVLVDPAGAFPGWHLRSFEPLRYLGYDRVHKGEMARRGDWEVIILGSSRAQAGLPATHPFLAGQRTCNLSLDGAKFRELAAAFDYARRHNPLKHVILCLDMFMFSAGADWIEDFPESRFNPAFDRFDYYCKRLISQAAADEAWHTFRQECERYTPPAQAQYGFFDTHLAAGTSQRALFGRVLRIMGHGIRQQTVDPANVDLFRQMVRECRDQKMDLQIAIMPVHALHNELLYAAGGWSEFEHWEAALVNVLAEEGVEGKFCLWDFTGYAGPPAEPVPAAGDVTNRMQFFFENSHCTPVFGGLILDTMFGGAGTNRVGVRLDRSNLKGHLACILAERAEYARTNAADIDWVRCIIAQENPTPPGSRE